MKKKKNVSIVFSYYTFILANVNLNLSSFFTLHFQIQDEKVN